MENDRDNEETALQTPKHHIILNIIFPEELNKKFLEAFGWANDSVDEDLVQKLLDNGADINAADNYGCTSLIRSATSVKVLQQWIFLLKLNVSGLSSRHNLWR